MPAARKSAGKRSSTVVGSVTTTVTVESSYYSSRSKRPKRQVRKPKEQARIPRTLFPLFQKKRPKSHTFHEGITAVANLLRNKKNIAVLTGAGISVSCGIPDFRTKGSGLYSTLDLEELGLSCPEDLFDWDVFQEDPVPFYHFARNLYFPLGNDQRARPSDSHKLLAMLDQKKQLRRVYSQNIDGLEQEAGVSERKVVYAHGSLLNASCIRCKKKVKSDEIEADILAGQVSYCQEVIQSAKDMTASPSRESSRRNTARKCLRNANGDLLCGGVMKPGVTFFGQALEDSVSKCIGVDKEKVDALIVIGTSLSVAPISKVIGYMPADIPRILINRTVVHPACNDENLKDDPHRKGYVFDAYLLGNCDDITRALAKHLFADSDDDQECLSSGRVLSNLDERSSYGPHDGDEYGDTETSLYNKEDWGMVDVPHDRVFLFPGAAPPSSESDNSGAEFQEVAICDGCSKEITGTIHKCAQCFDYDLCGKCFGNAKLRKKHHGGKHTFY